MKLYALEGQQNTRLYFLSIEAEMPGLTLGFVGRGYEASIGSGQQLAKLSVLFHTSDGWSCSSNWQEHYVDDMLAEKEKGNVLHINIAAFVRSWESFVYFMLISDTRKSVRVQKFQNQARYSEWFMLVISVFKRLRHRILPWV